MLYASLGLALLTLGGGFAAWHYCQGIQHPLNRWHHDRRYDYGCTFAGISLVPFAQSFGYNPSLAGWLGSTVLAAVAGWLLGLGVLESLRSSPIHPGR